MNEHDIKERYHVENIEQFLFGEKKKKKGSKCLLIPVPVELILYMFWFCNQMYTDAY